MELEKQLRELFNEYLKSSENAFNQIHNILSPKVMIYLRKRLKKDEDIAEVYQGFFMKLHKSRGLLKADQPVLPWIYSILRSELLDFIKINKRHIKRVEAVFQEQLSQTTPVPSLDNTNAENSISTLLNDLNLKPDAIELLQMRFEEDLSTKEMALRLNITEPTLRKRLSRLLDAVKSQGKELRRNENEQ